MKKDRKIGICLSGGGALGYAHIGALQALEEAGIEVNYVSGTSMGAIVGVLYAAGYSPKEIFELIEKEKVYKTINLLDLRGDDKTGFSKHTKLRKVLDKYLAFNEFDSLKKHFFVCCTDIRNGIARIFDSGSHLKEYVIASASIPCIYESVMIDGVEYLDGGIVNNFPIEPLIEQQCDVIFGVSVVHFTPYTEEVGRLNLLPLVYALMDENINKERHQLCHHFIAVEGMNTIDNHIFSFKNYQYIYQCGYQSMKKYLSQNAKQLRIEN